MQVPLFDEVGEALRGLLPPELGELRQRPRQYGIKVWFGPAEPPREHYEAQVIGARHVENAEVLAIEIGFHAEYAKAIENDSVIAAMLSREREWRRALGKEAVAGEFLGRDGWRRVSEVWPDPDLSAPDLSIELALRLTDYITALEGVRRDR